MLAFIFAVSAVPPAAPTLIDLMVLTQPYVDCRRTTDQKIVVLQQKIQSRRSANASYDHYADPDYMELTHEVDEAEKKCDLPKYVLIVKNAIAMSDSYSEFQNEKMAEFIIEDITRLHWTFMKAQSGNYNFPMITLLPSSEKANQ